MPRKDGLIRQPIIAGALLIECVVCGTEQLVEDRMVSRHVCACGSRCFDWSETSVGSAQHRSAAQQAARARMAKAWGATA